MIENHVVYLIVGMIAFLFAVGVIGDLLTRQKKYYYKHDGYRWKKKRY
jgi:hypothetical protein